MMGGNVKVSVDGSVYTADQREADIRALMEEAAPPLDLPASHDAIRFLLLRLNLLRTSEAN